jgi:hypothetical protein
VLVERPGDRAAVDWRKSRRSRCRIERGMIDLRLHLGEQPGHAAMRSPSRSTSSTSTDEPGRSVTSAGRVSVGARTVDLALDHAA